MGGSPVSALMNEAVGILPPGEIKEALKVFYLHTFNT